MAINPTSMAGGEDEGIREIALDGLRYALLRHKGHNWRLASLSPLWREQIALLDSDPDPAALDSLESRGIWLARASTPPPLAVICGGLGASWPRMGLELYENFPAAREAMEGLASLADWDLLGLLEEDDQDKISKTRWQIPYIFLLEYAQWAQLRSLGLNPALVGGHSLGELVGLCLAGVYPPEAAWYLLDTRSRHMDKLESIESARGGMLAVSGDGEEIERTLAQWPNLHVANRNTPRQYVLSGPRAALLEARKSLRKNRVPAFMLNMNLAFHNPAMRILRDISLRRLNSLEMHAPEIPMLSCLSGSLYPDGQAAICECIANLDENTVDWPASVHAMREYFGIRNFLELGPQEIVCGLINELAPDAACFPSDSRGREALAMRQLCARLFAQGHLSFEAIAAQKAAREGMDAPEIIASPQTPAKREESAANAPLEEAGGEKAIVLELIAKEAGREAAELRPDMDLRFDLGLRSSRFPLLAQAVEQKLGRTIELENIFPLATLGDLVGFFLGQKEKSAPDSFPAHELSRFFQKKIHRPPLLLMEHDPAAKDDAAFRVLARDPARSLNLPPKNALMALCVQDGNILPKIWESAAIFGAKLAIPAHLLKKCRPLEKFGAILIPLDWGPEADPASLARALERLAEDHGEPGLIFIAPRAREISAGEYCGNLPEIIKACAEFAEKCVQTPALRLLQRWKNAPAIENAEGHAQWPREIAAFDARLFSLPYFKNDKCRIASLCDFPDSGEISNEAADMLPVWLFGDCPAFSLFTRAREGMAKKMWRASSPAFDFVYPDLKPEFPPRAELFQGACQFSRFANPQLSEHGGQGACRPQYPSNSTLYENCPWLPFSFALGAMMQGVEPLLPWLRFIAISDLRLGPALPLPAGISRECRLQAWTLHWIMHDKAMARLCKASLQARDLAANGRRGDFSLPVCEGTFLLSAAHPPIPPIWRKAPRLSPEREHAELLKKFYDCMGYGENWRILENFAPPRGEKNGLAGIAPAGSEKASIAYGENWRYRNILNMLEGLIQACAAALALDSREGEAPEPPELARALSDWRCAAIGFIRFDVEKAASSGKIHMQFRQSWREKNMARFDAQAYDEKGKILLTLHHIEFNRPAEE